MRTYNRHEDYNKLYIPATLHLEADVTRQLTLGLKGEMDWLMSRGDIAPKNLIFGLVTIRYNFVKSKAAIQKAYYEGEISALNDRVNAALREAADANRRADAEAAARKRAEQENAELQRRPAENNNVAVEKLVSASHFVQFDHDVDTISKAEQERLKAFAQAAKGHKVGIVAEASTPGTAEYNQKLSERRLARVVDFLLDEGFKLEDIEPQSAIGSTNAKPDDTGRRVTLEIR